jgi:hypothetical protein
MSPDSQISHTDYADGRWKWLYRLGGAAAILSFVYIPTQILTFMTVPEPTTAVGWFALFNSSQFQGLMSFEFMFIVSSVIGITTNLALYVVLKQESESFMAIALVLSILGAMCIIFARPAIDMMYLAGKYAAATSEAQKAMFETAGETLLAMRHGSAFQVSYNLGNINLLIIPLVMLRSKTFNKATATLGLIAGILGFGLYIPGIGVLLSIFSVVFMGLWDILIGIRFFQLGKSG